MKPRCAPSGAPRRFRPSAAPFPPLGPPRRVPQLRRYYGAVRLPVPLSPRFVAFAWRYPAVCLWFAPGGPGHQTAGLGFIFRSPLPDIAAGKQPGPPRFPDNPLSLCPVLRPRQDRTRQAVATCQHGPRYDHRGLPRKSSFRGSIARLQDSLFTLRPVRCHTRRKTRFRPLAKRYRTGLVTRRVVTTGF